MICSYPVSEAMVLAEMITSPAALAACGDLETADLADMRNVVLLYGIRWAQGNGLPVNAINVLDGIEAVAMERGLPNIANEAGGEYLAQVLRTAPKAGTLADVTSELAFLKQATRERELLREGKSL